VNFVDHIGIVDQAVSLDQPDGEGASHDTRDAHQRVKVRSRRPTGRNVTEDVREAPITVSLCTPYKSRHASAWYSSRSRHNLKPVMTRASASFDNDRVHPQFRSPAACSVEIRAKRGHVKITM
jgi:hypothetical protein